jgi:tetratricopeptide (TPR) repeat protein
VKAALASVDAMPPVEGEAADRRQRIKARALWSDGDLAIGQGENLAAQTTLMKAIAISRLTGDKLILGYSLGSWALAATFVGAAGAEEAAQESLSILREVGDTFGSAMALVQLARTEMFQGNFAGRRAHVEDALRLLKEAQNPLLSSMMIFSLGMDERLQGNAESARLHFLESLHLFQQQRNKHFETVVLSELAHIARLSGDRAGAMEAYRQTMPKWKDLGHQAAIAHQLECFAFIARAEKQMRRAARLLGAAEALREMIGSPMTSFERAECDHELADLRAHMDEIDLANAWTEGRSMTMEEAIAYALETAEARKHHSFGVKIRE